jgi:hypothetical protein
MNLNVEPNILLILLGALFILIGASGKIFIEKFSVALASITSRLFIAVLGLCMLGIGIIGPSNFSADKAAKIEAQPGSSQNQPPTYQQDKVPWFHTIVGTYTGIVTSTGVDRPVKTTYTIDAKGTISGITAVQISRCSD